MKGLKIAKSLTKLTSVLCVTAFAVSFTADVITQENKDIINRYLGINPYEIYQADGENTDSDYFKSDYDDIEPLIDADRALVKEVEAGGAVLLKNENDALPLDTKAKNAKVSVFGVGSVDPIYYGSGSADPDKPGKLVTLKDGFSQAGIDVNPTLYNYYSSNKSKLKRTVDKNTYKMNDASFAMLTSVSGVRDSFSDYGDAAIVMLQRSGGEQGDVPFKNATKTDGANGNGLALTENEKSLLLGVAQLKGTVFQKIIVLLNTSNQIEAEFLKDENYKIDAALWIGTVGNTGLESVGDILVGKVNPSGRLSDTWWNKHSYNPAMANYGASSYSNASNYSSRFGENLTGSTYTSMAYTKYVAYQEGIYVGYRYSETRYFDGMTGGNVGEFDYEQAVGYPFGFGLSYTSFEYSGMQLSYDNKKDEYTITVNVTNKGSVAGREVVQVYLQKPYTDYDKLHGVEKSAVELVGYTKTKELAPNKTEQVVVAVSGESLASYDAEYAKSYIVESGNYSFTVGKNAHDATKNFLSAQGKTAEGNETLVKTVEKNGLDINAYGKDKKITNLFDEGDINKYENAEGNEVDYYSRKDFSSFPSKVELYMTEGMANDLLSLKTTYVEQDDIPYPDYEKQDENMLFLIDLRQTDDGTDIPFDSPVWDRLMDELSWEDTANILTKGMRMTGEVQSIVKPATVESNGPTGVTNAYIAGANGLAKKMGYGAGSVADVSPCSYPCLGILAATFDRELAERVGKTYGENALWAGYSGLYGVSVNTHRTAYDGRAFEYYSEDGFLAGMQAASFVLGLQSKGCNAYVKHIAGYEMQEYRVGMSVWCNEQAYREIYLKPFKLAIEKGGARNVMASYSRVGVTYCPASHALLTDFLRGECGLSGFVVSDMWSGRYSDQQLVTFLMAGCDLPDGTLDTAIFNDYQSGYGKVANQMRLSAKRILYSVVHSNAMNGYTSNTCIRVITPEWQLQLQMAEEVAKYATLLSAVAFIVFSVLERVTRKTKKSK